MAFPTLDMALFFGTSDQQQEFSSDLLRHLKIRGVAKIKNHGIPDEQISQLFNMTRRFFALSHEEKMHAKHPPQSNPNRGYSYVGQESIASISAYGRTASYGRNVKDIKETYDLGNSSDELAANRWPQESSLPGFRSFMETFYDTAFKTELSILSALATALDVSKDRLKSLHSKAENEFRLLHYPAVKASELRDGSATRIAEHTDFGTVTMLFQDSTGGLQVEDQDHLGTFHNVVSESKYEIILNVGDSLQRLTNDTLKAACHRVTFPPSTKVDEEEIVPERYSVAYFAKVNRSSSLFPFKKFIEQVGTCRYRDITSGDFNDLRIAKLFAH